MSEDGISRRRALKTMGTSVGIGAVGQILVQNARATNTVTIKRNEGDSALRGRDECCTVNDEILRGMGVTVGEQIRVGCNACRSEYESGLYTVVGNGPSSDTIEMSKDALGRLGLKNNTSGFARAYAPHPDYETRNDASEHDEYVEILLDDGEQSDLIACAVHGGWIEYRTDAQSAYVADELGVTEWSCVGYNSGGGAYDRWHITSTDVDRRSFPKLDRIGDRGFAHAVSFHGFGESGIAIGGGADESLQAAIRDEIDTATDGRYDVYLADSDGAYAGNSSENFVNWLSDDNGIQIEQSWDARTDDWETIAAAVVQVYARRL